MSGSNFVLGFGSKLYRSATGTGTYTLIAQTKDLKTPETEVPAIKITNNSSPNNSQEYTPANIREPGEIEYEAVYFATGFQTLWTDHTSIPATVAYYQEVFTDGSGQLFQAWPMKVGVETKTENEANIAKFTLKLTTFPTYQASGLS